MATEAAEPLYDSINHSFSAQPAPLAPPAAAPPAAALGTEAEALQLLLHFSDAGEIATHGAMQLAAQPASATHAANPAAAVPNPRSEVACNLTEDTAATSSVCTHFSASFDSGADAPPAHPAPAPPTAAAAAAAPINASLIMGAAGHSAALASAMWTQLDHVDGAASAPAPGDAAAAVSAAEAASAASAAAISAAAATASTTTTLASAPPAHSAPEPPSAADADADAAAAPPTAAATASVSPRKVTSAYVRISRCIEREELAPDEVAALHRLAQQIEQDIVPAIMGGLDRKCKDKGSFMECGIRKKTRVGSTYNLDARELPICAAASIMKQGYCIVPNPPGFVANIRSAIEEAKNLGLKCAQFHPIGQLYPGPEFGRNPNTGDGKRLSADGNSGCKWGNLLHTMIHCIIAQYDLGTHILKLKGDELTSFMEASMLESLPGVNVQGGHFDTGRACDIFMQHGPSAPVEGIVTISPIDGPSNLLILETWASSIQPTAEEFAKHAKPIVIDADHTLLMSDHMPHAGGDMAGRRGHTIITRPDLMSRKLSEKKTFWLAPEQSRDA